MSKTDENSGFYLFLFLNRKEETMEMNYLVLFKFPYFLKIIINEFNSNNELELGNLPELNQ